MLFTEFQGKWLKIANKLEQSILMDVLILLITHPDPLDIMRHVIFSQEIMFTKIKEKREESGFTLMELLITILIIGILIAIAIAVFLNQRKLATEATLKSDLRNAGTVVEGSYNTKNGYSEIAQDIELGNSSDVKLSEGTVVSIKQAVDRSSFCIRGINISDPENVWYYSSLEGGLVKSAEGCQLVENSTPGNATGSVPTGSVTIHPLIRDYFAADLAYSLRRTPEVILAVNNASQEPAKYEALLQHANTLWAQRMATEEAILSNPEAYDSLVELSNAKQYTDEYYKVEAELMRTYGEYEDEAANITNGQFSNPTKVEALYKSYVKASEDVITYFSS